MLEDILHKQSDYAAHDGERFMDAVQNARLVTDAELCREEFGDGAYSIGLEPMQVLSRLLLIGTDQ